MEIIDRLTEDVFNDQYFTALYSKCTKLTGEYNIGQVLSEEFSHKEFKDLLKFADILSNSNTFNARNRAYKIIANLNPLYKSDPIYRTISKAVYSKLGNFPALHYLNTENGNSAELPIDRELETEAKKFIQQVPSTENFYFTDPQYNIFKELKQKNEFSFSGPTSMGKSFLIKAFLSDIILNESPNNIVILVPTRALINQFSIDIKIDLKELLNTNNYKVATNSNVAEIIQVDEIKFIYVLTPERLISYLSQDENTTINYLFVDEAHKLANENDARSITAYTAIESALKKNRSIKLYFSSPNVSNPEALLSLYNKEINNNYARSQESPVSQNLYFVDVIDKEINIYNENNTIELDSSLLDGVNDPEGLITKIGSNKNNLIYCNTKRNTIKHAQSFVTNLDISSTSEPLSLAARQVSDYIHPRVLSS